MFTLLDLCVSSLRRGHANLLCTVSFHNFKSQNFKLGSSARRRGRRTLGRPVMWFPSEGKPVLEEITNKNNKKHGLRPADEVVEPWVVVVVVVANTARKWDRNKIIWDNALHYNINIRSVFIISNRKISNWASQVLKTNMLLSCPYCLKCQIARV